MAGNWPHCPCPRPVQCHAERTPWASGSSSRTGETRRNHQSFPALRSLCRISFFYLTPQGLQGNLWGWTQGLWLWGRREEGFDTTNTWVLADRIHTSSDQRLNPKQQLCSSAELIWDTLWPGSTGRPAWFRSPKRSFASPRAWFSHIHTRSWVTDPHTVKTPPASCAAQRCLSWEKGRKSL